MGVSDPDRLEQIAWALPKELGNYDFLAANGHIVAKDSADENVVWVAEIWDSQASHDASLTLPAVKKFHHAS